MKIGILCTGRCGSTSLYEGIKESICKKDDYQFYFENNKGGNLINGKRQSINFIDKNILAKDLITSMPCDFWHTLSIKKLINNLSNFYINYAQNFDIIILLMRQNELHATQSWNATKHNNYFNKWTLNSQDMDLVYPIEDLDYVRNMNDVMYNIAKQLKKPIIYYEDLFSGSKEFILNFIKEYNLPIENFDILYSHLDPKSKYNLKTYV
jgi:hypothetical protein